jgi:hypothetical protein
MRRRARCNLADDDCRLWLSLVWRRDGGGGWGRAEAYESLSGGRFPREPDLSSSEGRGHWNSDSRESALEMEESSEGGPRREMRGRGIKGHLYSSHERKSDKDEPPSFNQNETQTTLHLGESERGKDLLQQPQLNSLSRK